MAQLDIHQEQNDGPVNKTKAPYLNFPLMSPISVISRVMVIIGLSAVSTRSR